MRHSLLPGFVLAGFECSTPLNTRNERIDELSLTQHDQHVREDYRRLRELDILAARDGVRWNLVDRRGRLDFSSAIPFLDAAEAEGITVVWDLFHYGYPEDLDPFGDEFVPRFAAYCAAFAALVRKRGVLSPFYTPVNEISFFAWAACDGGLFAPHAPGRGPELKRRLSAAAIAGMDAIWSVEPAARFVHCDPLVHVVAPSDRPDLADEAAYYNDRYVCEAWDLLAGIESPELGGAPHYLDILGVNYYGVNQWEHTRPGSVLAPDDPRRKPFSEMLRDLYDRYERPIIVTETASCDELRSDWIAETGAECMKALRMGVDLHGFCLYPIVDMVDWHGSGETMRMGLWDLCSDGDAEWLARALHEPSAAAVRTLQAEVNATLRALDAERRKHLRVESAPWRARSLRDHDAPEAVVQGDARARKPAESRKCA